MTSAAATSGRRPEEDAVLALLGRWTANHRILVLAGWVVIALAGAV